LHKNENVARRESRNFDQTKEYEEQALNFLPLQTRPFRILSSKSVVTYLTVILKKKEIKSSIQQSYF